MKINVIVTLVLLSAGSFFAFKYYQSSSDLDTNSTEDTETIPDSVTTTDFSSELENHTRNNSAKVDKIDNSRLVINTDTKNSIEHSNDTELQPEAPLNVMQEIESNESFDELMDKLSLEASTSSVAQEKMSNYLAFMLEQPEYMSGVVNAARVVCGKNACMVSVYYEDETDLDEFINRFDKSKKKYQLERSFYSLSNNRANVVYNTNIE